MHPIRFAFITFLLLAGCSQQNKKSEQLVKQINALKKENLELRTRDNKLEATVANYERTLSEVDFNLRKIESNLTMMGELGSEMKQDDPIDERVKNRAEMVQRLINNSALKVHMMDYNLNELRRLSGQQSDEILKLDKSLKNSTKELIEKTKEFESQKQLMQLSQSELEIMYADQKKQVDQLADMLNRAYLFAGNSKELKENMIINKEGGFIGLGRVKILNASSNESLFVQLKKNQTSKRAFKAKKIKLLTRHDEDSYTVQNYGDEITLTILDEKAFWKHGNYLVVQKSSQIID